MPYIKGLNSSFPKNKFSQKEIIEFSKSIFPNNNNFLKMLKVYENSGVKQRYLVSRLECYRKQRGWKETNFLFKKNAINLLEESITKTLNTSNTEPKEIGAIIVVNTTGVLTPSLDAEIINLFDFSLSHKENASFKIVFHEHLSESSPRPDFLRPPRSKNSPCD